MERASLGIGDMAVYVPGPTMSLDELLRRRAQTHPDLAERLERAVKNTGQVSFRFPEPWEDAASLAGNAAAGLLRRFAGNWEDFRYIAVGTETSVDHSKPIASYVQGMLSANGFPLPRSMTTFETKHACAGGTAALLATSALLGFSGSAKDRALVVCTDISRYDAPSTAEITQGSGAVAMVVERDPRLLELDMDRHGYFSSDVDDFFRPLGSTIAKVKGRYSMECYQDALEAAFRDYCGRRGGTPCELIDEVDYIALHVPFAKMPETALRKLLSETCGKNSDRIEEYLRRTRFLDAMTLNAEAGNLYTGSLYAYIMTLLSREYAVLGDGIVGKRILIASYGSGNTMIVFTATVRSGAPEVISAWDPEEVRRSARPADFSEYLAWLARPKEPEAWKHLLDGAAPRKGDFYLKGFSETGLRFYGRA